MENQQKKVLIVDDDEFLLEMYAVKFKESGFQVEIAKSGEAALNKMREGYVADVVLLDVVMPVLDGFELLRIIKKEQLLPKAVFIILTNLGQKEDIDRGLRLGADDYIVKAHFTPTEVVNKASQLLGKKPGA